MTEALSGIVVAIVVIILTRLLSGYFTAKLMATTILVAIAFIYVGFSLKGNTVSDIILECTMALFFYFLALIGYTRKPLLIAIGIILHGVWDILHHRGMLLHTDIPGYWPSFCLIVDVIDGLYFFFIFNRERREV
jgi:hypothetical protein